MAQIRVLVSKYILEDNKKIEWYYYPPGSSSINEWLRRNTQNLEIEVDGKKVTIGFMESNEVEYYFHMPNQNYDDEEIAGREQSDQIACVAKILSEKAPILPVRVFLHQVESYFPGLNLGMIPVYSFQGQDGTIKQSNFSIKRLFDGLVNNAPLAPQDFFFPEELAREILSPLLPLHLALQAFFGITRIDNGTLVSISEAADIDEEFRNTFLRVNHTDVFQPMMGSEGDSFVLLAGRLLSNKRIDNRPDAEQPLLYLVEKLFNDILIVDQDNKLNHRQISIDIQDLKNKINGILEDEYLKSICQVLADTNILIDNDTGYNTRVQQLNAWNDETQGKDSLPKSVIENIDKLADYLHEVIDFIIKSEQDKARNKRED